MAASLARRNSRFLASFADSDAMRSCRLRCPVSALRDIGDACPLDRLMCAFCRIGSRGDCEQEQYAVRPRFGACVGSRLVSVSSRTRRPRLTDRTGLSVKLATISLRSFIQWPWPSISFRWCSPRQTLYSPTFPLPEGAKVTDLFPGIRKHDTATRTVRTPGGRHIVFLRGIAPDGRKTGRHLYEWTVTGSLPLAAIEYSIADELCSRFEVRWLEFNRRPWGLLILQEVKKLSFEHLRFLEGVYLRAVHLSKPGEYGIIVNWKAKSEFRTTLAHDDIGKIALGCSVILQETKVPEQLERFVGRFAGRVKQLNGDSADVVLPNGETSSIPRGWLVLESSPHNVASFDGAYPSLRPREGTVVARLRLDKTLVGNNRNSSIYKDRLTTALAFLNPNAERQRLFPLCSDATKHVAVSTSPLVSESRQDRLPRHSTLPQPNFLYRDDKILAGNKKTEGMLKYGPYQQQPIAKPLFGFLFAESHRVYARKLFAGLRGGTGYYKGFQAWFKVPILIVPL